MFASGCSDVLSRFCFRGKGLILHSAGNAANGKPFVVSPHRDCQGYERASSSYVQSMQDDMTQSLIKRYYYPRLFLVIGLARASAETPFLFRFFFHPILLPFHFPSTGVDPNPIPNKPPISLSELGISLPGNPRETQSRCSDFHMGLTIINPYKGTRAHDTPRHFVVAAWI
jgi:hypothetical protein